MIEIPARELFVYQNIPPRWETNPIQLLVKTLLHTLKYLWNGIKRCQKIQEFAERLSWTGFLQLNLHLSVSCCIIMICTVWTDLPMRPYKTCNLFTPCLTRPCWIQGYEMHLHQLCWWSYFKSWTNLPKIMCVAYVLYFCIVCIPSNLSLIKFN